MVYQQIRLCPQSVNEKVAGGCCKEKQQSMAFPVPVRIECSLTLTPLLICHLISSWIWSCQVTNETPQKRFATLAPTPLWPRSKKKRPTLWWHIISLNIPSCPSSCLSVTLHQPSSPVFNPSASPDRILLKNIVCELADDGQGGEKSWYRIGHHDDSNHLLLNTRNNIARVGGPCQSYRHIWMYKGLDGALSA